jgi:2-keto-3-deoxy-L-rhamnonate aldolase RhmA
MASVSNNLHTCFASNKLCKAFGIKISTNTQIVALALNAGFDSLFIDLEHAFLTLGEASNLCTAALLAGITPFVRVPHQCGNGFIQRVLDGGAMGVIFPHIHSAGTTHVQSHNRIMLTSNLQMMPGPPSISANIHRRDVAL